MATPAQKLRPIHLLFVEKYLEKFDVAYAAEHSGLAAKLGTDDYARVGRQIMRRDYIAAAVEERLTGALRGIGVEKGKILNEVCSIAFARFDPRRLYREDGTPRELDELDDETASFIEGIEIEEVFSGRGEDRIKTGEIKKYKIRGRKLALDAAKMLGENLQIWGDNGIKDLAAALSSPNFQIKFVAATSAVVPIAPVNDGKKKK